MPLAIPAFALRPWTADDVRAAVEAALPALCAPGADLDRLLALSPGGDLSALIGQLHPAQVGDLAALGQLALQVGEPRALRVEGGEIALDQSSYPPTGHQGVIGDLEVAGDLFVSAALVITGDLTVRGTLRDCGPDSKIVVLGDLRCRHLETSGWITVGGDAVIGGVLAGRYNDDVFEAHGSLQAGLIVTDDHAIEAEGGIRVRHTPEEEGGFGEQVFDLADEAHLEALRPLLGAALDEDGAVDLDLLPEDWT